MQHLAHAVACSACSRFAIAVMQHLAHAVLIHSLSLTRAWAVAWAVLATRMWTPDSGQRPLQQREINDRQQLVKERRLQKTVLVWCVCWCQKYQKTSANTTRTGVRSIRRLVFAEMPVRMVFAEVAVRVPHIWRSLYIGSCWCLCLSACTPRDKRARHARLLTREHEMHAC